MKKLIVVFICISVLLSCKNNDSKSTDTTAAGDSVTVLPPQNDSVMENVYEHIGRSQFWMDTLSSLSFVKKTNAYLDSLTNHKHGIAFLADSTNPLELIFTAGYNGPQRFETYYQFYVSPKTKQILVYDPVTDKKLTIKQYKTQLSK